jgi:glycerol-3-phosphate acyltransferase PlsY
VTLLKLLLAVAAGYLLGSIPMGFLVGKAWGVDVLAHGSGRTGGTNVWRATGQIWPPVLTVLGDSLKGIAAVLVGRYLLGVPEFPELAATLAGAAAVLGHNWSLALGLRGGAGGMTAGAALVALCPVAGAITVPLSLAALYFSHYASVGTLSVGLSGLIALVIVTAIAPSIHPPVHILFGILSTLLVAYALRPNLKRLANGTERRITLW